MCQRTAGTMFKQWEPLSQWHSITPWLSINVAGYCAWSMTTFTKFVLIHFMNSSMMWWDRGYKKCIQAMIRKHGVDHLEDVNMRIILEWILKKHGVNRIWPRVRSSVGLLWISNEHLSATESQEFLDWLSFPWRVVWVRQTGWALPAFLFTNYLQ